MRCLGGIVGNLGADSERQEVGAEWKDAQIGMLCGGKGKRTLAFKYPGTRLKGLLMILSGVCSCAGQNFGMQMQIGELRCLASSGHHQ
jgi:hypothetical protein